MLAQISVWVRVSWGVGRTAVAYCMWICVHCIHASASKQTLSNGDFHNLSMLKCNRLAE